MQKMFFLIFSAFLIGISYTQVSAFTAVINDNSIPLNVRVGEENMVLINITNTLTETDTYLLDYSIVAPISYWTWFNGHRYDSEKASTSIKVGPKKSANIGITIFGGQVTGNTLTVRVRSAVTGVLVTNTRAISISYGKEGLLTETPEFGWHAYFLMAIIAATFLL